MTFFADRFGLGSFRGLTTALACGAMALARVSMVIVRYQNSGPPRGRPRCWCEPRVGHATRCTSVSSSPRSRIRSMTPCSAAWSWIQPRRWVVGTGGRHLETFECSHHADAEPSGTTNSYSARCGAGDSRPPTAGRPGHARDAPTASKRPPTADLVHRAPETMMETSRVRRRHGAPTSSGGASPA
jgi:hypothetical protein